VTGSSHGIPTGAIRVPLDELARGLDAGKPAGSGALEGLVFTTDTDDGSVIRHHFHDGTVTWRYLGLQVGADTRGTNPYEAFLVDSGLYFVQFQRDDRPIEATSLVLDVEHGRTIAVTSVIGPASPGSPTVAQVFRVSELEDHGVSGTAIERSDELTGSSIVWTPAQERVFMQRFIEPSLLEWSWLAGPGAGLSTRSRMSSWRVRPGIHLVATRDLSSRMASVAIVDHRSDAVARSHGVLFGLTGAGTSVVHLTYAADGLRSSTAS
jgi:hypothetical protein